MAQAAKAPAKPESAEPSAAPPKRGGKILLIVVLIAVLFLLIAVVGIGALLIMKKSGTHESAEGAAAAPPPVSTVAVSAIDLSKPPVFVPLDPFTVNLRVQEGEEPHYLQTELSLRVLDQKTAEALKGWMPEIRNRINLSLATKSLTDIQNDAAHEKLANEILRALNTLFGVPPPPSDIPPTQAPLGPIQGVLFVSFIVQ
jgi:flagellar FliL protein